MGFGIMFLGYFVTFIMALNTFGVVFRLVGYLILAYSSKKLSEYNRSFIWSEYFALVLMLISAIRIFTDIMQLFTLNYLQHIESGVVLLYHIFLLIAIRNIAKDTDVEKIQTNALRNLFFIGVYYLLYLISVLPTPLKESFAKNMALPLLLLNLAWIILDLIVIFSCYSQICDEGDAEMERKPSRFAFVNKFRDELDAKQARARETSLNYKREKAERKKKSKK